MTSSGGLVSNASCANAFALCNCDCGFPHRYTCFARLEEPCRSASQLTVTLPH